MKMEFNRDKNNKKESMQMSSGSFGDMISKRNELLPDYESVVSDVLSSWNGQLLTIILSEEDENGNPTGSRIASIGCSSMQANIYHAKSIDEALQNLIDITVKACEGQPETLKKLFKTFADAGLQVEEE